MLGTGAVHHGHQHPARRRRLPGTDLGDTHENIRSRAVLLLAFSLVHALGRSARPAQRPVRRRRRPERRAWQLRRLLRPRGRRTSTVWRLGGHSFRPCLRPASGLQPLASVLSERPAAGDDPGFFTTSGATQRGRRCRHAARVLPRITATSRPGSARWRTAATRTRWPGTSPRTPTGGARSSTFPAWTTPRFATTPGRKARKTACRAPTSSNPTAAPAVCRSPGERPTSAKRTHLTAGRRAESSRFLRNHDGDRPFFVAAGFHKPHQPWVAPVSFFEQHPHSETALPDEPADDRDDIPAPALVGYPDDALHNRRPAASGDRPPTTPRSP